MKLLLIEDEKELRKSILSYLSHEGYICEVARDFNEGQEKINSYAYDCFIIDLMMPGGSGLDLVKEIKTKSIKGGIIIISAKDTLEDRIAGLDLGSDDYLTKPFHLAELNARVKSIVRRRQFDGNTDIVCNEIRLVPENHEVFVHDVRVNLTGKEFDLLLFFVSNKGRVLPKDSIAEHIWGDYMDQTNSFDFIYTHIKNMRKKLIEAGCKDYLHTVYGIGYKFLAE